MNWVYNQENEHGTNLILIYISVSFLFNHLKFCIHLKWSGFNLSDLLRVSDVFCRQAGQVLRATQHREFRSKNQAPQGGTSGYSLGTTMVIYFLLRIISVSGISTGEHPSYNLLTSWCWDTWQAFSFPWELFQVSPFSTCKELGKSRSWSVLFRHRTPLLHSIAHRCNQTKPNRFYEPVIIWLVKPPHRSQVYLKCDGE